MGAARLRGGFSLIELMVAIGITVILTSQLLLVFTTQHRSYVQQGRVVETQQDLRLLTDMILGDLRMGGFMVPREASVGSIDGGTSGTDILCMSDPTAFDSSTFASATDRFEGASVTSTVSGSVSSVTLSSSEMDIDSDGNDDFVAGGGILITDGTDVHCAEITGVSANVVDITPSTPSGISMSPLATQAVPAMVYQVNGTVLTRNGTTLSDLVEDLQVEFWVDDDDDGEIDAGEFPIHDLSGSDTSKLRVARVYVTTRTAVPEASFPGQRIAAANRVAGAADNFRRRRAIADARLRNAR